MNKSLQHVFAALMDIRQRLPSPLLGIDSDNGSEFINAELLRYCKNENLVFTRSRHNRKNDGCHIEQKNWSIARQNVGYGHFETQEEFDILNELYSKLRLHTNFFMSSMKLLAKKRHGSRTETSGDTGGSMKLLAKKRHGSRISKKYDQPNTPYHRVLQSEHVSKSYKQSLIATFPALNPAELRREIASLRDKLYRYNKQQRNAGQK